MLSRGAAYANVASLEAKNEQELWQLFSRPFLALGLDQIEGLSELPRRHIPTQPACSIQSRGQRGPVRRGLEELVVVLLDPLPRWRSIAARLPAVLALRRLDDVVVVSHAAPCGRPSTDRPSP